MEDDDKYETLVQSVAAMRHRLEEIGREVHEIRSLVGPFAATFPDGSMLVQTIHGLKYFIDPDDLIIAPQMVIYRQWEADILQLFRQLCTPDSVVVDVGANFAYFSVLAANLIGTQGTGRVFSFEPNPKLANLFRKNREINWSIAPIEFHEIACGEVDAELTLYVPKEHGANGSLSAVEDVDCDEFAVPVRPLDEVLAPDVTVDIMKIDVEGHEATVLRGAQQVIARSRNLHLILEWSQRQMRAAGIAPEEVLCLLDGFTPHKIALGSNPLEHPQSVEWLLSQDYTDVLFKRR